MKRHIERHMIGKEEGMIKGLLSMVRQWYALLFGLLLNGVSSMQWIGSTWNYL